MLLNRVKNNDLDALKSKHLRYSISLIFLLKNFCLVVDASAKLPSGLLRGNLNQFGDFDECVGVAAAHYCLAEIDLRPVWKEPFLQFRELLHSYFAIKEEFNDVSAL